MHYNFLQQPDTITEGNSQIIIFYGSDRQRVKTVCRTRTSATSSWTVSSTRYHISRDYEKEVAGSSTRHYNYIFGDYGMVAVNVQNGSTDSTYYVHTDHLGSITTISNPNKQFVRRLHFDTWGNPKKYNNWQQDDTTTLANAVCLYFGNFYRGFTGHEHYPQFKVINMNGRIYDPVIARFFSPDLYVANSSFTQDYNRYSYCLNNPLMYKDPSGEFIFTALLSVIPGVGTAIGAIIDAACWGAVIGGAGYTASVAFSDGGFNNWNWGQFGKSMGIGAISGVATAGIGQMFGAVGSNGIAGEIARAYTHGFANGTIAHFTGGDFMQGFASGGLSSLAGSAFMMYGGSFANSPIGTYAFSGLAGGAGAALTGGNFWEGAAIGLMNAGLNHLAATVARPSFEDLLANFPMNESGGEMPAGEVYELIGGKVLSEHQRAPNAYNNACALRVSRALNGSGVDLPNIPGKTLTGADGRNYFYRAKDLYNWMTQSYGKPNISTTNYSSLSGNKGTYIMQATRPGPNDFGAWGHATLYNMAGTIGNSYASFLSLEFLIFHNMKKIFYILVLPILLLTNCSTTTSTVRFGELHTTDLENAKPYVWRELLKEYFLCACITEEFKDKKIDEDDISQAVYFDILRYSPEAFQEVKDYAKKLLKA